MEKAIFRILCLAFLLTTASVYSQGGTDFTGQVLYHTNYPLSGVHTYLHTAGGNIVDSAVTNNEGLYSFEDVTPGNYVISFSTEQPEGGIDLSDANLVMQKIFNLVELDEIQTLAADVNGSGTITWNDYFMIVIGYLNQGNPFPQPWVFESISTPIPVPARTPFTTGGGSSSGDVNGSLVPDPKSRPVFIESPFIDFTTNAENSLEFNLTCTDNQEIAGMHLAFSIPEDLEVINAECAVESAAVFISGDRLNVTWMDENMKGTLINEGASLLKINARMKNVSREQKNYSLILKDASHFIDKDGQLIEGLKLSMPTLNVQGSRTINCSAYPNPFSNNTTIEFTIPVEGQVLIGIYDQAGRQVKQVENGFFSSGKHSIKIDGTDLYPGIYHYTARLSGNGQNVTTGTIIKSK
jgi:hypothetical protein